MFAAHRKDFILCSGNQRWCLCAKVQSFGVLMHSCTQVLVAGGFVFSNAEEDLVHCAGQVVFKFAQEAAHKLFFSFAVGVEDAHPTGKCLSVLCGGCCVTLVNCGAGVGRVYCEGSSCCKPSLQRPGRCAAIV